MSGPAGASVETGQCRQAFSWQFQIHFPIFAGHDLARFQQFSACICATKDQHSVHCSVCKSIIVDALFTQLSAAFDSNTSKEKPENIVHVGALYKAAVKDKTDLRETISVEVHINCRRSKLSFDQIRRWQPNSTFIEPISGRLAASEVYQRFLQAQSESSDFVSVLFALKQLAKIPRNKLKDIDGNDLVVSTSQTYSYDAVLHFR